MSDLWSLANSIKCMAPYRITQSRPIE